ncbi:MAG TPA: OmpA family protein [Rhizomicrobium sp.]|nr:OmpA family protein [Rhizomicrobium sp.]
MTKIYARALAVLTIVIGMGTGGCETMSDLDPTGLLSEDAAPESQFPTESAQQAEADAATTTPDLAGIPTRPAAPSAAVQADTAQQVAAAGAQAQYSADALRAGTDAAAPPPTVTNTDAARQALASTVAPPGPAPAAPSAPSAVPSPPVPVAESPAARSTALAPPGAEPAVPAVPATAGARRMAAVNPSDAELGFKPSSAPPLNPAVAQWVAPPIMAHYRQTAAAAGSAGTGIPAVPAVAAGRTSLSNPSGDVVANLEAVPGTPTGMAAAMNGGVPPAAIVYFPGDTTSLSTAARAKVRDAVAAFRATGGAGTVKVVGHASSRTANMPVERHLEVIFQKSQARANAVAQALIRAGIPASQVRIEAVGDSQPVFYESMPKGEDGNRRAEIFILG